MQKRKIYHILFDCGEIAATLIIKNIFGIFQWKRFIIPNFRLSIVLIVSSMKYFSCLNFDFF